jgi:hypothetical protein
LGEVAAAAGAKAASVAAVASVTGAVDSAGALEPLLSVAITAADATDDRFFADRRSGGLVDFSVIAYAFFIPVSEPTAGAPIGLGVSLQRNG